MSRRIVTRRMWLGVGAPVVAVLIIGWPQVEAREPRPYCFQGGRGTGGGILDCSYYTWEQCLAMVTGGGEGCSTNPELGWRALERARTSGPVVPKHPQVR